MKWADWMRSMDDELCATIDYLFRKDNKQQIQNFNKKRKKKKHANNSLVQPANFKTLNILYLITRVFVAGMCVF